MNALGTLDLGQLHELAVHDIEDELKLYWTSNNSHFINSNHVYYFPFVEDVLKIVNSVPTWSNTGIFEATLTKLSSNVAYNVGAPSNVTRFVIIPCVRDVCAPGMEEIAESLEEESHRCHIDDVITSVIKVDRCDPYKGAEFCMNGLGQTCNILDNTIYECQQGGIVLPNCLCPQLLLQLDVVPIMSIEGFPRIPTETGRLGRQIKSINGVNE